MRRFRFSVPWSMSLLICLALVVVGLPLVAVLVFFARPVFLVAVVALPVLALASPRFRRWLAAQVDEETVYKGLRLDPEVQLAPGHTWVRATGRHLEIGVDDLVQATLGPVDAVDLPLPGAHFERGDRLFRLRRGARAVALRAPVSGQVLSSNEDLGEHPGLVNQSPFHEGWTVRMRGDDPPEEGAALLAGGPARQWFRTETDRLIGLLQGTEDMAPALPDGGELVPDVFHHVDDASWGRVKRAFFEPAETAVPQQTGC